MESVWLKPEAWPRNSREWVFLAHAVDVIGHRMFGSDWRLDYFATGVMKQLPYYEDVQQPLSGALPRDRHYETRLLAYVMLRKTNPSYRPQVHSAPSPFLALPRRPSSAIETLHDYSFTREQWLEAQKAIEDRNAEARAMALRFRKVTDIVLDAATVGSLRTSRRAKHQAVWTPIQADVWSIVDRFGIFTSCQIDPGNPSTIAVAGDRFELIFVHRADLDHMLSERLTNKAPDTKASSPTEDVQPQPAGAGLSFVRDGERVYREWLASNDGKRRPKREEDEKHLRALFPKTDRDEFRKLRDKFRTPKQRQGGRPLSKTRQEPGTT